MMFRRVILVILGFAALGMLVAGSFTTGHAHSATGDAAGVLLVALVVAWLLVDG